MKARPPERALVSLEFRPQSNIAAPCLPQEYFVHKASGLYQLIERLAVAGRKARCVGRDIGWRETRDLRFELGEFLFFAHGDWLFLLARAASGGSAHDQRS
jgi:hypothetical protein